jgi:hypothetical protein
LFRYWRMSGPIPFNILIKKKMFFDLSKQDQSPQSKQDLFQALNGSNSPIEMKKITQPKGITKQAKRRIRRIIVDKETTHHKSIRMVMLTMNKGWKIRKNKKFFSMRFLFSNKSKIIWTTRGKKIVIICFVL